MSSPSSNDERSGAGLMAAVMGAVQAYLDEEARSEKLPGRRSLRAWKLAARQPITDVQFRSGPSWTGRD